MKCKCGANLSVDYQNKENEEGECFYEIQAECENKHSFEISGWGEIEDKSEAEEYLSNSEKFTHL